MNIEVWKDIPGFEGIYQINNRGVIKSLSRVMTYHPQLLKSTIMKRRVRGKILKVQNKHLNKKYFFLYKDGRRHPILIKDLIEKLFHPV